ncbi:MAG: TetR/AcrR family transcriptional regulator [Pseudohongiellaceae bacterium]
MNQSITSNEKAQAKKEAVFDAASEVFAQYGFRRTTMNDIAQAVGISRPALYLMFSNKENLFCELTNHRLNQAIEQSILVLSGKENLKSRFINALLIFEKVYYEPVSDSPHGAELMDVNQSLAGESLMKGFSKLVASFARTLKDGEKEGLVSFENSPLNSKTFVELLFTAIGGVKKKASSTTDFRKKTEQVASIFLASILS